MEDENRPNEGEEQDGTTDATSGLGDAGKRALDAERTARRKAEKELGELRAQLKTIEDEGKSEVDRLREQVATLTKENETATVTIARFEVAAAKGLTPAQARRLVGSTKEELEADADAMVEELGLKKDDENANDDETVETPAEESHPYGERPKENLQDGAAPAGEETVDSAKLAERILSQPF